MIGSRARHSLAQFLELQEPVVSIVLFSKYGMQHLSLLPGQLMYGLLYTLDESAEAYLNGNKFFQRHAVVVGSTGSGKSWTTARILEQVASLSNANAIVFDIHGEYAPLASKGCRHFRIAGPGDLDGSSK